MLSKRQIGVAVVWLAGMLADGGAMAQRPAPQIIAPRGGNIVPPKPAREFRGVWIATVDNIDWPSKKDLSTAEQKAELLALLDRAAKLKFNAVIFQVRPQCDALYSSQLEPWSEFLTGQMGKAPSPMWDPLAFAITEAHQRGLELHAWFNPYRALHPAAKSTVSANHISRTKPQLVRSYGKYLWLDPGEREVQEHSLAVVMDVVKRYDVDGVHFDDYFYPYPEKDGKGQEEDFPDEASWQKSDKKMSRADWRRENSNLLVQRVYQAIKAEKPWVKFGVSPFGIWQPGNPPQIKGFNQHEKLYADARKWLINGWADYFAPQLYWPIDPPAQSFSALLSWWNTQNPKHRHIWPGIAISRLSEGWNADEITRQIRLTEKQPVSSGQILYSIKHLGRNPALVTALQAGAYRETALIPAMPWLPEAAPQKPTVTVTPDNPARVSWNPGAGNVPKLWVLQYRTGGVWKTEILSATTRAVTLPAKNLDAVAVSAVNRVGVISSPAVKSAGQ